MSALPAIHDALASDELLANALAVLFEPSPVLFSHLVPGLVAYIPSSPQPIRTYSALIDASLATIATWPDDLRARFVAGHPRIGEVSGLSRLSANEQAAAATPPDVLARLAHLNACYERRYPGLRYITFVNGRTRAAVMAEMEGALGLEPSLSPDQPPLRTVASVDVGGQEWRRELDRAVVDVGRIAKSRLRALGAE
ncbi:uncharacterized protein FIBRA_01687 [Fibroporia radiculosa]|uniref:Oxo-4-hydroxy-4-carboxy-5-ureidoimidazoline decarboxylase domain-containing protein n=1 Tax=Fibroporia radiculosa TaxID=599839 RepID=J4I8M4_9APHY|nr:uncharacterized protein FIBRA_01687 [Fibroporia radiculosa]CCL99666.1 predicted protein [Fibroporia radiculosa]